MADTDLSLDLDSDKPALCPICGKAFRYYRGVRAHAKMWHRKILPEKEPELPCPFCPEKVQDDWKLISRIKKMHKEEAKLMPGVRGFISSNDKHRLRRRTNFQLLKAKRFWDRPRSAEQMDGYDRPVNMDAVRVLHPGAKK